MSRAYRASAKDGSCCTRNTARAAALAFFEQFPGKRKCNVREGQSRGHSFIMTFSLQPGDNRQTSWKDITPKTVGTLPDVAAPLTETEQALS